MRKKISIFCMVCGLLLITAAISLAVFNRREEAQAGKASADVLIELRQEIENRAEQQEIQAPSLTQEVKDPQSSEVVENAPISQEMTVVEIDGYGYIGYLSIPALELELPIMSEWDYTRLKKAPCLYFGSVKTDNMVIAAHNYSRHFGRLSSLKIGDTILFTDMDGRIYTYEVGEIETLQPTATKDMIDSDWELSLYTCTYSGKNRMTVRCKKL